MSTIGIYGFFDKTTNECLYVGMSSISVEKRKLQHLKLLRSNRHSCKGFNQWYFENHDKLVFKILEQCEKSDLNRQEIEWFNSLSPKYYGKKPSMKEKWELTDRTKSKIRKSIMDNHLSSGTHVYQKCASCEEMYPGTKHSRLCLECKQLERISSTFLSCVQCGEAFKEARYSRMYCSDRCKNKTFRDRNPEWSFPKKSTFGKMDKDMLSLMYTHERNSIGEIAEFFGCKERTVYYHLKRHGIPKRTRKSE